VRFATSNVKSKDKKKVLGISVNESKIIQRKFLLPVGKHKDICKNVFFRSFGMSSAVFHQLLHQNMTAVRNEEGCHNNVKKTLSYFYYTFYAL